MQQYLGKHKAGLFMLAYAAMTVFNDVTVYPDVKNKLIMSTLITKDFVKPFNTTFTGTADAFKFVPRELDVRVGKGELQIFPEKFRQTYLAYMQTPGVARTPQDLPFAGYIMEAMFKQFGQELNSQTVYNGVYDAAGNNAAAVADGYGTILAGLITDGDVSPTVLGAVDSTNALEQYKELWRGIPEKNRDHAGYTWTAFMSRSKYEAYTDNLDNLQINTGRGDDIPNTRFLRGSEQKLELRPVSWMSGSNRILITPKENIVMGTDQTTLDLATANIIQQMWGFDLGIAAALGFNFIHPELIYCNELA
jgi:hypothetical protein